MIENVRAKITELETAVIMTEPMLTISGDYLIVTDLKTSSEKGIFVFDKNTLDYLGSTGFIGEGPGQITRYGEVAVTPSGKEFWMPDFAKLKMFKFNIDSVLNSDNYLPAVSVPFKYDFFLSRLKFATENIAFGTGVEVLSPSTFRTSLGRWDLDSETIEKFGQEHPELTHRRTSAYFDYSYEHNRMALAYVNHDILSVFNADGSVLYHIIGEKGLENENRNFLFFGQVHFGDKYIIASYLGGEGFVIGKDKRPKVVQKSKLFMFDLEGNLSKVIDTDQGIRYFAVDDDNSRIICYFTDRQVPLGYFCYQ